MKRVIIISITVAFLYILQSLPAYRLTSIAFPVTWIRMQADIACIFVIYLGVREKSLIRGAVLALIVGLFANSFAPSAMRLYAFLAPLCFVLTYVINICLYFKRLESYVGLVFVMSLAYNHMFFHMMSWIADWPIHSLPLFWPSVVQAMINAFFGALIFTFFDWIKEMEEHAYPQRIG